MNSPAHPTPNVSVEVRDLRKSFHGAGGAQRHQPRDRPRRNLRHHGAERQRQERAAQAHHRTARAGQRRNPHPGRIHRLPRHPRQIPHGHGLSVRRPADFAHCRRKCRHLPQRTPLVSAGGNRPHCRRQTGSRRPQRRGRPHAQRTFRRHAKTGRHRPRAGH